MLTPVLLLRFSQHEAMALLDSMVGSSLLVRPSQTTFQFPPIPSLTRFFFGPPSAMEAGERSRRRSGFPFRLRA